ncbi:MAG: polysaccharide deacetylase family protein [Alphaproteobacteria bacterium]|nr:polysaccharide deacetylase family protein [Alphaproteobacteria bacterium]
MTLWTPLDQELALWRRAGRLATLWWRDDDAEAPSPALDRLLRVTRGLPVALAVVPAGAGGDLAHRLTTEPGIGIIQHGWQHRNHQPVGSKTAEFGDARPVQDSRRDLQCGWMALTRLFGSRVRPVLVPPWNRIDPALAGDLPGYAAISVFGSRRTRTTGRSLWLNTHIDPIRWRDGRRFIGAEAFVARLVEHLAARRTGAVDPEEVTGLLTHHLAHDEALWEFLEEAVPRLAANRQLRFLTLDEVLA